MGKFPLNLNSILGDKYFSLDKHINFPLTENDRNGSKGRDNEKWI